MLSKFPNSSLKVGAPVSLSPQSRFVYGNFGPGPSPHNPVGVRGVVTYKEGYIRVCWDGNLENTYCIDDHDLICEGEPGFMEVK